MVTRVDGLRMPHLQFELTDALTDEAIDAFADWATDRFATVMATGTGHVAVTVRDGVALHLGRADDGPVAVLNADIRAGRSADQRRDLAEAVIAELADRWDVPPANTYVVFTEHPGADFHLEEGPLSGWSADEAGDGPIGSDG